MISIIIPMYNVAGTIKRTLESILASTCANYEVIMVDDGSTDNSASICKNFCNKDNRFKYYYKDNEGVAMARNYGIHRATGDYISFVDADDTISEDAVEILSNYVKDNQYDIVSFGWTQLCGEEVKSIKTVQEVTSFLTVEDNTKIATMLLTSGIVNGPAGINSKTFLKGVVWNSIFRRELIEKNNISFFSFWNNEDDWIFDIMAFLNAKATCFIPDQLYNYTVSQSSLSRKKIYVEDIFIKRKRGIDWALSILNGIEQVDKYKKDIYIGVMQRKLLLLTLYNETSVEKHMSSLAAIKQIKLAVKMIMNERTSKGFFYEISKSEFVFAVLLKFRLVALAYYLNRYVFKVYRCGPVVKLECL